MLIYKNKSLFLIKNLLIILCLFFHVNVISNIKFIISQMKEQIEITKNEKYLNICNNNLNKIIKFKKINNPKISIISPIYNSEQFILRFLKSIQSQNFNEIEIILIDDCSKDNTIKIIEEYKKKDKRILFLKNKKNKGTFISRNIASLYAKGHYIMLPDPDDIISKNILTACYIYAQKYNYDIIRFNMYRGKKLIINKNIINELENKPLYQPELSYYLFYGNNNKLNIIDFNLCNKFIRKEVYIKVLDKLKESYLNIYITYSEDFLFNYFLYKTANSFFHYKTIGYYYIKNNLSITNNLFKKSKLKFKFFFIILKLFFEYSKNSIIEKDIFNLLLTNFNKNSNNIELIASSFIKNDYKFYYNIIKN